MDTDRLRGAVEQHTGDAPEVTWNADAPWFAVTIQPFPPHKQ